MKKLTGFNLKYLALVLMVMDHIHYMFEFTGYVPIWFSWLGRIAAPLFLFCLIEGFIHTHDRKKYFKKIYFSRECKKNAKPAFQRVFKNY